MYQAIYIHNEGSDNEYCQPGTRKFASLDDVRSYFGFKVEKTNKVYRDSEGLPFYIIKL